ncbi:MAG TPA: hypothetical protein VLD13_08055 [Gaiellaceae bacterium]|nr:hypothetical protein [Gaiellaceae bacterium]
MADRTLVERYLELGLQLGRHADDLVDSYYGPEEVAQRVAAEEPREPEALAEDAAALAAELGDDPWLAAQVQALAATGRKLAGADLGYAEEGALVYGIEPRWHDESAFRRGAALLDEALPGTGGVRDRYARWLDETVIPGELLEQALLDTAAELRRLTREKIGLPEGEDFELELVTGERWTAYAHYLGGLRTRISVNTDLPLPAAMLVHLTAHEIYGGHHTHRVWQEAELVLGRGQLERTLDLLWSPEAVISEGVAEVGPQLLTGDGQALTAEVLGRLGFGYDAEVGSRVSAARLLLAPVSSNVAMLLHDRGASTEEAREYAATWSLLPDDRVEKTVASQAQSPSPPYQHAYWQGYELVDAQVRGDARRFRELLTARVLPSDLSGAPTAG